MMYYNPTKHRMSFMHSALLTPTSFGWHQRTARRVALCVTPSRHRTVHKAGRWVWSTGDGRRSTADNTWRRSTCRCELDLSSEVGEKL